MNISDVAKLAGVSSATVSRYFNHGYLSEEKREAIRKVVEETGYRPSVQAQSLRTRRSKAIGLLIPRLNSSSISAVVSGILAQLNERGYHVLIADSQNNPERELEYIRELSGKQVDGLIMLATVYSDQLRELLNHVKIPVVVIGQRFEGFNSVYHDDYHAIYDMTELVQNRKCRHIGYIGVLAMDQAVGENRYRGFCDSLEAHGRGDMAGNYVIAGFNVEEGYEGARAILSSHPDLDAIICATDNIAAGVMQYLEETGRRVPEDIVVTGQGDSLISRVVSPPLTTIHYDYEESGTFAVKLLLSLLNPGEETEDRTQEKMFSYKIIERESTRRDNHEGL